MMTSKAEGHVDDPPLYRARVAAALAPMHSEPLVASQQVSQQLAGHDIDVMDIEGDWIRGGGDDDDEGWMPTGFVLAGGRHIDHAASGRMSLGYGTKREGGARRS